MAEGTRASNLCTCLSSRSPSPFDPRRLEKSHILNEVSGVSGTESPPRPPRPLSHVPPPDWTFPTLRFASFLLASTSSLPGCRPRSCILPIKSVPTYEQPNPSPESGTARSVRGAQVDLRAPDSIPKAPAMHMPWPWTPARTMQSRAESRVDSGPRRGRCPDVPPVRAPSGQASSAPSAHLEAPAQATKEALPDTSRLKCYEFSTHPKLEF